MTRTCGDFWREWKASSEYVPHFRLRNAAAPLVPAQKPQATCHAESRGHHVTSRMSLRIGDQVTCNAADGVFRPCRCGSTSATVREGKGPHAGRIQCNDCGRRSRWLSRAILEAT